MDVRRPLAALAWRSRAGAGRQHMETMPKAFRSHAPYCSSEAQPTSGTLEEPAGRAKASGEPGEGDAGQEVKNNNKQIEIQGVKESQASSHNGLELLSTLRSHVQHAPQGEAWPRLTLAYTLEEQGELLASRGNFTASYSSFSEACALFGTCSIILPSEPECLLRQWVTSRRAREVGDAGGLPDVEPLRRCVQVCCGNRGKSTRDGLSVDESSSITCAKNMVCYEAHLELAGALLENGQFERCVETARHIIERHDAGDAEALNTIAQALEVLGRSREAAKYAQRAAAADSSACD